LSAIVGAELNGRIGLARRQRGRLAIINAPIAERIDIPIANDARNRLVSIDGLVSRTLEVADIAAVVTRGVGSRFEKSLV
jgi:hypothetical protein